MRNSIILLSVCSIVLASCGKSKPDISGNWKSETTEALGNGTFGNRVFEMADSTWQVQFTLYLDSAASMPVFRFRATGNYELGNPSGVVKEATEALFRFDHKYVTLLTTDSSLITNLGFTNCALTPDQEKDITDTGCSFLESKSACAQEYDLVSLRTGKLFLGSRPEAGKNICREEDRPVTLGAPLVKVK